MSFFPYDTYEDCATEAEINRERYHAEIADLDREAEIDEACQLLDRAGELGVDPAFITDADEESARQRRFITRVRFHTDDVTDDEFPF